MQIRFPVREYIFTLTIAILLVGGCTRVANGSITCFQLLFSATSNWQVLDPLLLEQAYAELYDQQFAAIKSELAKTFMPEEYELSIDAVNGRLSVGGKGFDLVVAPRIKPAGLIGPAAHIDFSVNQKNEVIYHVFVTREKESPFFRIGIAKALILRILKEFPMVKAFDNALTGTNLGALKQAVEDSVEIQSELTRQQLKSTMSLPQMVRLARRNEEFRKVFERAFFEAYVSKTPIGRIEKDLGFMGLRSFKLKEKINLSFEFLSVDVKSQIGVKQEDGIGYKFEY